MPAVAPSFHIDSVSGRLQGPALAGIAMDLDGLDTALELVAAPGHSHSNAKSKTPLKEE